MIFFLFLLIYGGLGFGIWDGVLDWFFLRTDFHLMGFGACGVVWGLLGFMGWGSLYEHKRINLGKEFAQFSIQVTWG